MTKVGLFGLVGLVGLVIWGLVLVPFVVLAQPSDLMMATGATAAAPPGTGPCNSTAPPPAAAVGFTTLAFCFDFSSPANSNINNWLACKGAASPTFSTGVRFASDDCTNYNVTTDPVYGGQVLDIVNQDNTGVPQVGTCERSGPCLWVFGPGYYVEGKFRLNSIGPGYPCCVAAVIWHDGQDSYSTLNPNTVNTTYENDFIEYQWANPASTSNLGPHIILWNSPGGGGTSLGGAYISPITGIDPTIYHVWGDLETEDNSAFKIAFCAYEDGINQNGCASDGASDHSYWLATNANGTTGLIEGLSLGGPDHSLYHVYFKWVRVWRCTSNGSTPCFTAPVTTSPPANYTPPN